MKRTALLLVLIAVACAAVAGDSSGAASNYPSPLYLGKTDGSITGSWRLASTAGLTADLNTTTTSANSTPDDGWYTFVPGQANPNRLDTIPTDPDGYGWVVDSGGAAGFPAGDWSFKVETKVPDPLIGITGTAVLTVGMWTGTVSGGVFTPSAAIIDPQDDPDAQNLRHDPNTLVSTTVTIPDVPKFAVAADEVLFVEFWRRQVDSISTASADQRTLDFVVNDGVAKITHPAADSTPPTHSLTVKAGSGNTYYSSSASTLYYNGSSAGGFTLEDAIADGGSGPLQVTYPLVSTTGWTHAAETVTTGPSYTSSAYSWAAAAGSPGTQTIVAEDKALQTSAATLTVTSDTAAPTGQTVALSGGPWYTSLSVPLKLGSGSDAGAGVDPGHGVVERAAATLTNGACGTFGSFAAVTLAGDADPGVATGNCYRYQYKAADKVGNLSTASTASADAKVDATPPTTPSFLFTGLSSSASSGSVVYYRPAAGTAFTVSAASSDGESGIASYSFPAVAGFTAAGFGPRRTYSFSNAAGVPAAPFTVTATNGAGLTSASASFTLVPDGTPPTLAVRCNGKPCLAATYAKPVTITATTSDGTGSGVDTIRYTTDGTDPTVAKGVEYGRGFAVRALTRLKMRAFDKAGNASDVVVLTIRSAADGLVFAAPPRLTVKTGAHYLSAKVSSSRRAIVSATMTGPNLKKPQRWRFILSSGTSIVQLRLPAGLSRRGVYEIVWAVQAGTQKTGKTTRVVFGPPKPKTR